MEASHTFKTNQWYFVTFTWDPSGRRIYVDGLLVGQDSLNVINDGGDAYDWFIGNDPWSIPNNLQKATIKIDDIGIYNYARSQEQIKDDMKCSPSTPMPDLEPYEITWKPSSPSASDGINIACCVKNQGNADAVGKFYTKLYVDGVEKNTWSKDGLAAGNSAQVSMGIGKLSAGDHTIKVEIDTTKTIGESNGNNNIYIKTLTVIMVKPILCNDPDSLTHDFGSVPKGQTRDWTFDITNGGDGTLTLSVSDNKEWITVNPTSGSTTTETDTVTVCIDTTGLECGKKYTDTITVSSDGDTKQGTITVYVPEPGEEYIFITKWGEKGNGDGEFNHPNTSIVGKFSHWVLF